jgi:uncharacterized protein YdeI (BOF family)
MRKIVALLLIGGALVWWGRGHLGITPDGGRGHSTTPGVTPDTLSISTVMQNPRTHSGTTITVSGKVTRSLSAGVGAYVLNDGTGRLLVQTNKAVPSTGRKIIVTGEISQMAKLGGAQLLVLKERRLHSDGQ